MESYRYYRFEPLFQVNNCGVELFLNGERQETKLEDNVLYNAHARQFSFFWTWNLAVNVLVVVEQLITCTARLHFISFIEIRPSQLVSLTQQLPDRYRTKSVHDYTYKSLI